ncbi:hypothetical protein GCM10023258_34110 [Terrabacter aeriphilus]|uniref:VCBS repeat-containing protein n=1 Tax=Terrabacter aeriphilus TaxID=515662 RepID=A0ABP9JMP1_9MICO
MARHVTGASGLVLGLAASLLAPIALATPAGAAAGPTSGSTGADPQGQRGRTGHVLADGADAVHLSPRAAAGTVAAASTGRALPKALRATSHAGATPQAGTRVGSAVRGAGVQAAPSPAAGLTSCSNDELWVNTLAERSVVHVAVPGASSIVLQRQRDGGAWRSVATVAAASGTVKDASINQRSVYLYRLVAKRGDGTVVRDCATEYYQGTWTRDGWGTVDAVVAASTGVYQQGEYDQGSRSSSAERFVAPAFSADGRLYAVTRVAGPAGHPVLEVRRASTSAVVFTVDLGAGVMPADPAFSFDGQTLAFSRYDAGGEPIGVGFVDLFGAHAVRSVTTVPAVAEPAWRADGSLVVSTFGTDDDGLGVLCRTCTTVTPLAGTSGGYTPEVAPNGTIWFTTDDGARSTLKRKTTNGVVATVRSSATDSFASPRLTTDGSLFVERDVPDPADANAYTVGVHRVDLAGAADGSDDELSAIGWEEAPSSTTLHGWDVRQVQGKGTSNRTGDGHHDLLARDGKGALWAYRNTGMELDGRAQIGSGWGLYRTFVSVGDLTGDDQADLVARDVDGTLWLYRGRLGSGGFLERTRLGTGWGGYTVVGPGDWNGDGIADILARDGRGTLWLYPGTGRGTLAARAQVGTGWSGMTALVASGDVDFDGRTDLIARDGAGRLLLYPGNGTGGFLARRQIGSGWGGFTSITVSEATYGRALVWARTASGELRGYEIYGDGAFVPGSYSEGTGWGSFLLTA